MTDIDLRPTGREMENLGWRALWSFIFATTSTLTGAAIMGLDIAALEAAGIGGIGAVMSVVKNFASVQLGRQTA